VVALTDGLGTAALAHVNAGLALHGAATLDRAQLGAVRLAEMRRAVVALGVAPSDLYAAHLDDPDSDCGGTVSLAEAEQVERAFAERFPEATHLTLSYAAERQPDHLAAGQALLDLVHEGVVHHALWAVSRLWWELPMPRCSWVPPAPSPALTAARLAYSAWDPQLGEYAIGYLSVPPQFAALALDDRELVHGATGRWRPCAPRRFTAPPRPRSRPRAQAPAPRAASPSARAAVRAPAR
jgi:LmbE family N-acetylglucosaminyl deacetylase